MRRTQTQWTRDGGAWYAMRNGKELYVAQTGNHVFTWVVMDRTTDPPSRMRGAAPSVTHAQDEAERHAREGGTDR